MAMKAEAREELRANMAKFGELTLELSVIREILGNPTIALDDAATLIDNAEDCVTRTTISWLNLAVTIYGPRTQEYPGAG